MTGSITRFIWAAALPGLFQVIIILIQTSWDHSALEIDPRNIRILWIYSGISITTIVIIIMIIILLKIY
jgi:hypothetical protein